jgi:hypothetical protein
MIRVFEGERDFERGLRPLSLILPSPAGTIAYKKQDIRAGEG